MRIIQAICYLNQCYIVGKCIKPKGILVHSTGCNNNKLSRYCDNAAELGTPSSNNWNQYNPNGRKVCVHGFIGLDKHNNVEAVQTLPWDRRCWGCGSGKKGSYNNSHIQFEICEDNLNDPVYFEKAYNKAVELCVYLCKLYNLKADNIVCHSEAHKLGYASNHADVMHWFPKFGKSMDTFRSDVRKALNDNNNENIQNNEEQSTEFKVRVSIDDLNIRTGAGTNYRKTGRYTGKGIFTIVEVKQGRGSKSGWGKLKSGAGWISLDFSQRI